MAQLQDSFDTGLEIYCDKQEKVLNESNESLRLTALARIDKGKIQLEASIPIEIHPNLQATTLKIKSFDSSQ